MATLKELQSKLAQREVSAQELVQGCLTKISQLEPKLNSLISVNDKAMEQARGADELLAKSVAGPLAGLPIVVKDLLCTKGLRTTAGSKMLSEFVPPYSATVVERLERAGAIVLAKANLDEFAMGSSNETSYFGAVKNPWNFDYVPGGSSGGSAVAVAADLCPAAIGTDTGGSIRLPAHYCGISGLRPTYGRVSRYGIVAYASSLDQAGPMAHTVEDCALLLEAMAGHDSHDATSARASIVPWSQRLRTDLKGVRIGRPQEIFAAELHPDVRRALEEVLQVARAQGAQIVDVNLPLQKSAVPVYYMVAMSEASSNLARYDGIRYGFRAPHLADALDLQELYAQTRAQGFGEEVKRRIVLGTYALSSGYYDAYYKKACQVRRLLRDEFLQAFRKCDVILAPVATSPAFRQGERLSDPVAMYQNDVFTTASSLAGLPGLSVPVLLSQERLPVGVQLLAPHFAEEILLAAGHSLQQQLPWKRQVPYGLQ